VTLTQTTTVPDVLFIQVVRIATKKGSKIKVQKDKEKGSDPIQNKLYEVEGFKFKLVAYKRDMGSLNQCRYLLLRNMKD
jgi:hypothetical protein